MDLSDPNIIIDWSHEREWRIKGDFKFEYDEISVIVGCQESKEKFIEYYNKSNSELLDRIKGIVVLKDYLEKANKIREVINAD